MDSRPVLHVYISRIKIHKKALHLYDLCIKYSFCESITESFFRKSVSVNQLLNKKNNRLKTLKDEIVPCMYMLSYISEQGPRKFFVCMDMSMTRNLAVARKSVMMATSTAHFSTLVTQPVSQPNLAVSQPNLAVRRGNLAPSPRYLVSDISR